MVSGAVWTFDDQGRLFLTDNGNGSNSSFYTVDPATGHKTLGGATGYSLYGMDIVNATIYGITTNGMIAGRPAHA